MGEGMAKWIGVVSTATWSPTCFSSSVYWSGLPFLAAAIAAAAVAASTSNTEQPMVKFQYFTYHGLDDS